MTDPATLLVALSSAPLTIGAIHLSRWLVPLVLPGLVARPAQQGAPTVAANDTRISDLERKVAALELAQANAYGQVLVHLADVRGDVKVVNSEITALASALRSR